MRIIYHVGVLLLFSATALASPISLYSPAHPVSGKSGSVLSSASLRHCLLVSFRALDGEQRLDTLKVRDGSAQFVDTRPYGNLLEDQADLIPDANLKAPRDLAAINGNIIGWSDNKLLTIELNKNCQITALRSFAFANTLNTGINRLGNSAQTISKRRVLTDQEVVNLIVSGANANQVSDALNKSALYDVTQPDAPFFSAFGPQLGVLENGALTRSALLLNGKTTIASLRDNRNLDLTIFAPTSKEAHRNALFTGAIETFFNGENLQKTLAELSQATIDPDALREQMSAAILPYIFEIAGTDGQQTLYDFSKTIAPGRANLLKTLKTYGLSQKSNVEQTVASLVDRYLDSVDSAQIHVRFEDQFIRRFAGKIYKDPTQSLDQAKSAVFNGMKDDYNAQGLVNYLIETLMGPLVSNHALLSLPMGVLLDGVTQNAFASLIDGALTSLNVALPNQFFRNLFLTDPACPAIPNSARDFLDMTLVSSGPRIDANGKAFFELLKLAEYYGENDNYNRLVEEIDQRIGALHQNLSSEFVTELTRGLNVGADLTLSITSLLRDAIQVRTRTIPVNEIVSNSILDYLETQGVKRSDKLTKYLAAALKPAKKKKRRRVHLARKIVKRKQNKKTSIKKLTVAKFITSLKPKRSQASFNSILSEVFSIDLIETSGVLKSIEESLNQLFPNVSHSTKLSEAISQRILTSIDHNLIGTFVSETIGQTLASMASNGGGVPVAFKKVWRAVHGDCLAEWQLRFDAAAALATTAGLPEVSANFFLGEAFLSTAIDQSIKFVVQKLLAQFLEGVFTNAAGSYPQWHLGLQRSDLSFDLTALSGEATRLASLFAHKDKLLLVQRNNGVSLPEPGSSSRVTVTLFDINGNKQSLSLGEWSNLSVSGGDQGIVLIHGTSTATKTMLLDFRDGSLKSTEVTGLIPISDARPERIDILAGKSLVLTNSVSGVFIVPIPS